jgi:hypothetical protein
MVKSLSSMLTSWLTSSCGELLLLLILVL